MSSTPGGLVGFTGLYRRGRATKYVCELYHLVCPLWFRCAAKDPSFLHAGGCCVGQICEETT